MKEITQDTENAPQGVIQAVEIKPEVYKRLTIRTATECRRFLNKVARMLLNDQISPQKANALTVCVNSILQSIRIDEQEKQIRELEAYINGTEIK